MGRAVMLPLTASLKVLLLPLEVAAFLLFLLIIGAIGLGVAMLVISAVTGLWRLVFRGGSRPGRRLNDRFT